MADGSSSAYHLSERNSWLDALAAKRNGSQFTIGNRQVALVSFEEIKAAIDYHTQMYNVTRAAELGSTRPGVATVKWT